MTDAVTGAASTPLYKYVDIVGLISKGVFVA
jgi:hypothetical protein